MMATTIHFLSLLPTPCAPVRADPTQGGSIPLRAYRYCEPFVQANTFGWLIPSPISFRIVWEGTAFRWKPEGVKSWLPLKTAQMPGYSEWFKQNAPAKFAHLEIPFLTALPETGIVQIWSGLVARTRRRWSLLVRGPVNRPVRREFHHLEGIVEFDWWHGPLFGNLQFSQTDTEVSFTKGSPLLQACPIPRMAHARQTLANSAFTEGVGALTPADWEGLNNALFFGEEQKPLGAYARVARRS